MPEQGCKRRYRRQLTGSTWRQSESVSCLASSLSLPTCGWAGRFSTQKIVSARQANSNTNDQLGRDGFSLIIHHIEREQEDLRIAQYNETLGAYGWL